MTEKEIMELWYTYEGRGTDGVMKFAAAICNQVAKEVREAEREACAVVAETAAHRLGGYQNAAMGIRRRGAE